VSATGLYHRSESCFELAHGGEQGTGRSKLSGKAPKEEVVRIAAAPGVCRHDLAEKMQQEYMKLLYGQLQSLLAFFKAGYPQGGGEVVHVLEHPFVQMTQLLETALSHALQMRHKGRLVQEWSQLVAEQQDHFFHLSPKGQEIVMGALEDPVYALVHLANESDGP
jgi:hypothetical protein